MEASSYRQQTREQPRRREPEARAALGYEQPQSAPELAQLSGQLVPGFHS